VLRVLCNCPQAASDQLATAQQQGLTNEELSTIRVFQVRPPGGKAVLTFVTGTVQRQPPASSLHDDQAV
jgi:hypothetical protein